MCSAISQCLRSPVRRLAALRSVQSISTSVVHNETILVKTNDEFVNKSFWPHLLYSDNTFRRGGSFNKDLTFDKCAVMNNDKPVIVNFHAEWCEPCKILTPKLMELIEPHDNLDLAVVDVEDNPELVHTFEVKAVPAVIAIRNGLIVDKFIGLVDAEMITGLIDRMAGKKGGA